MLDWLEFFSGFVIFVEADLAVLGLSEFDFCTLDDWDLVFRGVNSGIGFFSLSLLFLMDGLVFTVFSPSFLHSSGTSDALSLDSKLYKSSVSDLSSVVSETFLSRFFLTFSNLKDLSVAGAVIPM